MLTLEQKVTSLELSRQMKELGFPQKSLFYWSFYDWGYDKDNPGIVFVDNCDLGFEEDLYSAYLTDEVIELLGEFFHKLESTTGGYKAWGYDKLYGENMTGYKDTTPPNALAKLAIYLKKENIL